MQKKLCMVYLAVGSSTLLLLENSLISSDKNIGKVDKIVFTVGPPSKELLVLQDRFMFKISSISLGDFQKSDYEYGSKGFNRITNLKWLCISQALDDYELVVFSDTDVVWLRDPKPYLLQWQYPYPIGVSSESSPSHPINYCTGVMYFNGSVDSRRVLEALSAPLQTDCLFNDQHALNQLVKNNPQVMGVIFTLPEALFMNGLHYKNFLHSHLDFVEGALSPFCFHANFTVGVQNKIKLLKYTSNWFLN